jgi:hypothetical protein
MEPEGSFPHSQEPTTCPYPELVESQPISLTFILILCSRLGLCLPSGLLLSGFLTKMFYAVFIHYSYFLNNKKIRQSCTLGDCTLVEGTMSYGQVSS